MGFAASKFNSSLFIWMGLMCILLYLNDLVNTRLDLAAINKVKSQLLEAFEMKDLEDFHYLLVIEVIHTPDGIFLSQRHYVLNMLFKFSMIDCRPISTPLDKNLELRPSSGVACNKKQF